MPEDTFWAKNRNLIILTIFAEMTPLNWLDISLSTNFAKNTWVGVIMSSCFYSAHLSTGLLQWCEPRPETRTEFSSEWRYTLLMVTLYLTLTCVKCTFNVTLSNAGHLLVIHCTKCSTWATHGMPELIQRTQYQPYTSPCSFLSTGYILQNLYIIIIIVIIL